MSGHSFTAPLRIDFCGGFTDVEEIGRETGVGVCSAAIDLYHDEARRHPLGFGVQLAAEVRDEGRPGGYKSAIRALGGDTDFYRSIALRSDLPDSTGLGSSGAMTLMLVSAFDLFEGRRGASRLELVHRAHRLESGPLAVTTGHQDHLVAAFGDAHFLDRLLRDTVKADPFPLPPSLADLIGSDAFVVYARRKHHSAAILDDIVERMRSDARVRHTLRSIRRCNEELHQRLRDGAALGSLMETIAEASTLRDSLSSQMGHAILDDVRGMLGPWVLLTHALGAGGGTFVAYCRSGALNAALASLSSLRESGAIRVWFPKVNRRGLWSESLA